MTTPTKADIIAKATQLYYKANSNLRQCSNPELNELKEEGFLEIAKMELMTNKYEAQWQSYSEQTIEGLNFDIAEAMTTTAFISGSRGSGKSDIAMMIADILTAEKVICVVFDSSTDWLKRSSIAQYMTVKPYSNLPIPTQNTIFDLSLITPMQQQTTVENFNKKLFDSQVVNYGKMRYYVIFEESQNIFPLNALRSKNCQNSMRLLTVGRNLNVSICAVSQFPATVDKELIKNSGQIYVGYTAEPNTLNYWKGILGRKQTKKLKTLQNGEFLYYCRNKIDSVRIQPFKGTIAKSAISTQQQMIKPLQNTKSGNSGLLLKFLIVAAIGLLLLLGR